MHGKTTIKSVFLHCSFKDMYWHITRTKHVFEGTIFRLVIFLCKAKYTISNATVIVTYEISYNKYKYFNEIESTV
jgi:hypothetical protein